MFPRQTDIPQVQPGEPITQSLLNQIIGGANNGRNVTGSDIDVTQISSMVTMSNRFPRPNGDADILVRVKGIGNQKIAQADAPVVTFASSAGSWHLQGGLYYGSIFNQPFITPRQNETPRGVGSTSVPPIPAPDMTDCVIINLDEMDTRTYAQITTGTGTSTNGGTNLILQNTITVGRQVGTYGPAGAPLVAVSVPVYVPTMISITGTLSGSGTYSAQLYSNGTSRDSTNYTMSAAPNWRQSNLIAVNLGETSGTGTLATGSTFTAMMLSQSGVSNDYKAICYFTATPSMALGRITGVTGSTGNVSWTYQATFPSGATASAYNGFEWNGTNSGLIAGSPGSLGINVATTGTLTGGSCVVKPIGTTGYIPMAFDTVNTRWTFSAPNSAQ